MLDGLTTLHRLLDRRQPHYRAAAELERFLIETTEPERERVLRLIQSNQQSWFGSCPPENKPVPLNMRKNRGSWGVNIPLEPTIVPVNKGYWDENWHPGLPERCFVTDVPQRVRSRILELARSHEVVFGIRFFCGLGGSAFFQNVLPPKITEYGYRSKRDKEDGYEYEKGVGCVKAPEECGGAEYSGMVTVWFGKSGVGLQ